MPQIGAVIIMVSAPAEFSTPDQSVSARSEWTPRSSRRKKT